MTTPDIANLKRLHGNGVIDDTEALQQRLNAAPDIAGLCEELRAALEGVTPGPWGAWIKSRTIQIDTRGGDGKLPAIVNWPGFDGNDMGHKANAANARFIALSREAVPALLYTLERQAAEIERLRGALRDIKALPDLSKNPASGFDRGARAARLDAAEMAEAALTGEDT